MGFLDSMAPEQKTPGKVDVLAKIPEMPEPLARLVAASAKALLDENTAANVIQQMQQGDPAQAVARTVVTIMSDIAQKSKNLPREYIPAAVLYVLRMVVDFGMDAGVIDDDVATVNAAIKPIMQQLARAFKATPQEMQQLTKAFQGGAQ